MTFDKLDRFSKKPTDLPDVPSPAYSAAQVKSYYQTPLDELKDTLNNAMGDLQEMSNEPVTEVGIQAKFTEHDQEIDRLNNKLVLVGFPPPEKEGDIVNSPKIIRKVNNNQLQIFQALANTDGYLRYQIKSGAGGSGDTDTGGTWDLLRLQNVDVFTDGYVWYYADPSEGALAQALAASISPNNIEDKLFNLPSAKLNPGNTVSSLNGNGVAANTIPAASTKTWKFYEPSKRTVTLTFYTSTGSSDSVDIIVDGITKLNVNCQQLPSGQSNGVLTVEVQLASSDFTSSNHQSSIQIKNNHASNPCYIVGFNLKRLKDWDREEINNYKFFGTNQTFIDAIGSSDYAILDKDTGKYCGSFHGGETSLMCKIRTYLDANYLYEPYKGVIQEYNFTDLPNTWGVTTSVKIIQRTNINNKANTVSYFNFDKDGTMEMDFGFTNNTINIEEFFTALTCTEPDFDYVVYPQWLAIQSGQQTNFPVNEGKITQRNTAEKLELTIRFTKWNDFYNDEGPHVVQDSSYSKFYYGVAQKWTDGVTIPNLNFSKRLDFLVNWL